MRNGLDRRSFLKLAGLGGAVLVTGVGRSASAAEETFFFVQLSDTHWGFQGPVVNPDPRGTLPKAIAAVNALLTAFYLAAILPLLGIHLPLVKTMVFITFVAGLIPVVGNLISNVVVVIVSLSISPFVAAGSLLYLVAIHKLEYFLNARLVGSRIEARAWELLLAMLLMEAVFGIAGLIAAPIYYAYLKDELTARGWV